ncbi:hypothetical protein PCE1_004301 [Barthelona sp. PCE]
MKLLLLILLGLTLVVTSNIVEITNENYAMLASDHALLLKFYAPWCGHCQKLAPKYEEVATHLKTREDIIVGEVDCTKSKALCTKHKVKGYPTIQLHSDSNSYTYRGPRESLHIGQWTVQMLLPFDEPLNRHIIEPTVSVMLLVEGYDPEVHAAVETVSKRYFGSIPVFIASLKDFEQYPEIDISEVTPGSVINVRDGKVTVWDMNESLDTFFNRNALSRFPVIGHHNYDILSRKRYMAMVAVDIDDKDYIADVYEQLKQLPEAFFNDFSVGVISVKEHAGYVRQFNTQFPAVIVFKQKSHDRWIQFTPEPDDVIEYIQNVKAGKVESTSGPKTSLIGHLRRVLMQHPVMVIGITCLVFIVLISIVLLTSSKYVKEGEEELDENKPLVLEGTEEEVKEMLQEEAENLPEIANLSGEEEEEEVVEDKKND